MMTEQQLAAAYNQLDMLVQPEGDDALEALMSHIRELQQELAEAYADLNHYYRHVYQGVPLENLRRFYRDVDQELARAMERYPRMNSAHEAYAVILEELEELWQEIKVKQARHDHAAMRREAVQIAAMVTRFVIDVLEVQE
jgi:phosphate uptake regulator